MGRRDRDRQLRLVEELAIADQMIGGRLEVGLVPGILPAYFAPFKVDYASRREVTLEFARFLKAAYAGTPSFNFEGKFHQHKDVKLAVNPIQKPHPPMWIETRDPADDSRAEYYRRKIDLSSLGNPGAN